MSEKRVYVVQCLCPERHCVLAVAMEGATEQEEAILTASTKEIEGAFSSGMFRRECGICHAKELRFELMRTPFKTMEEARPALMETQLEQLATRATIDEAKRRRN